MPSVQRWHLTKQPPPSPRERAVTVDVAIAPGNTSQASLAHKAFEIAPAGVDDLPLSIQPLARRAHLRTGGHSPHRKNVQNLRYRTEPVRRDLLLGRHHIAYAPLPFLLCGATLLFVLGFTFVFVALGTSASLLGGFLEEHQRPLYQVSGGLMVLMGLLMTGLLRIPLLHREYRPALNSTSLGSAGPVLFGMAFALEWTPCVGPVLASILFYAGTSQTAGQGGLLLLVYSLGFGLPLVIGGVAWAHGLRLFSRPLRWYGPMTVAGGVLLVLVGALFIADQWYRVNVWTDSLLGQVACRDPVRLVLSGRNDFVRRAAPSPRHRSATPARERRRQAPPATARPPEMPRHRR